MFIFICPSFFESLFQTHSAIRLDEGIKPYCAFGFSSFDRYSSVPKHNGPKHNFKDLYAFYIKTFIRFFARKTYRFISWHYYVTTIIARQFCYCDISILIISLHLWDIFIYIYICMCVYVCIYICLYICVCVYLYMFVYVCVCYIHTLYTF